MSHNWLKKSCREDAGEYAEPNGAVKYSELRASLRSMPESKGFGPLLQAESAPTIDGLALGLTIQTTPSIRSTSLTDTTFCNLERPPLRLLDMKPIRAAMALALHPLSMRRSTPPGDGHPVVIFPHGIRPQHISTTFNSFMNEAAVADGAVRVLPPTSRLGDFIELRAEKDLVCGLSACSAEQSNNGGFKPIDYRIVRAGKLS